METFTAVRDFIDHSQFEKERERAKKGLLKVNIDPPIQGLIEGFAQLGYCFTLQCCYGHFVYAEQEDEHNLFPLPFHDVGMVTYRIAYIALCLQNSGQGRGLLGELAELPCLFPDYVQIGSPTWFWERQPNSIALQVEPVRFAHLDQARIDHAEALEVEKVRGQFFVKLNEIVRSRLG